MLDELITDPDVHFFQKKTINDRYKKNPVHVVQHQMVEIKVYRLLMVVGLVVLQRMHQPQYM